MDPTDCERQPLINGAPTEDRVQPRPKPILSNGRFLLVGTLLWLTIYQTWIEVAIPYIRPYIPKFKHHPKPITYPGEHIAWLPCGGGTLANRTLEPQNLHHSPRPPAQPRPKTTTNLLVNPGGPGASGTSLIYRRGAQLATVVGDGFHLLGFDPRGVNESRPLASCYPTPESRQELSAVRDKKVREDSGELWVWTGNFVQACADTMGEHGKYVNTPQTAADMNSILDAVGQRGLYYWGFSYGTILGQTYATMFPERAERVIIDGVANQFEWYEELFDAESMTDTDRVLEGFVEECIKAGEEDCALAGLAETKEELLEMVVEGVAKLKDEPVGVYLNNTVYGVLDYWAVWHNGVFPALYKPEAWRDLASNLASLLRGNATDAYLAYGRERAWETLGDGLKFVWFNDGKSGRENWPADRLSLVGQLLSFFNQTLFSDSQYEFYFSKQAWSIPRTHDHVPKKKVKTAHPLLLLSTTYDPVCPLVSAKSASDVFEDSRIVEVKGYGHCSIAVPSMCVAHHVRNFLYNKKLPDEDVQCEPDGKPYFSKPEEKMALLEIQSLGDEERGIRLAQRELARDSWLRPWRVF